jgi:hypothetical protein
MIVSALVALTYALIQVITRRVKRPIPTVAPPTAAPEEP